MGLTGGSFVPVTMTRDSSQDVATIVVSDLHLGEAESILTPIDDDSLQLDLTAPREVLERLAEALRAFIPDSGRLPTLVLAGDALGLSWASLPEALTLFRSLIDIVRAPGDEICDRIVYMPGNHDHHVWELARETDFIGKLDGVARKGRLPDPAHATGPRWEDGIRSHLLEPFVSSELRLVYPNLVLSNRDPARWVIIHHGHYAEDVYHFASQVRRAMFDRPAIETLEELESENFAWIDFVWSLLGRSGEAGEDFEDLFTTLRSPDHLERRADDLAKRIADAVDFPYLPVEVGERILARTLLERLADRVRGERFNRDEVCAKDTMRGLRRYIVGPSFGQAEAAFGPPPDDVAVIWGHTHKPFEKTLQAEARDLSVYNIGGWTVDSHRPVPMCGASIALLSDALDIASLRVFDDSEQGGDIRLEVLQPDGRAPTPFELEVERRARSAPWRALGSAIESEIKRRREIHHRKFSEC